MNSFERAIKLALASILVAMLAALGTLSLVSATRGGSALLPTASSVATQQVAPSSTGSVETTAATSGTASTAIQSGVADARTAVRETGSAVVTVVNTLQATTTGRGRFGQQNVAPEALGSGVIISSDGYIVTNQHVVADQQSLKVIFSDGTQADATLVGQDAYTDIAVIKVSVKVPDVATFADSDKLEAGQPVVAIGTALGDYQNTVTEGIISGLHRTVADGGASMQDLVQTDAAINHGNSGGPLLDLEGNVVGINTAVVRDDGTTGSVAEGLGFAIPSNTVKSIAQQLISKGSVSHPYLGISYQTITPQFAAAYNLSREQGVYVGEVVAGSPADKAGIQQGSIITAIDGKAITEASGSTLTALLSKYKVGDSVKLTVVQPNSTTDATVTVVLGERPAGQ